MKFLLVALFILAQSPRDAVSTIQPQQLPQYEALTGEASVAPDVNCGDFATWQAAQGFYNTTYAFLWQQGVRVWGELDVHGLDRDVDGIACETLTGSPFAD